MDKRQYDLPHQNRMSLNPTEVPIVSSDAGNLSVQEDPNSPASIARRAKIMEAQSGADTKYDATPPSRVEGYGNWVEIQWDGEETKAKEITLGLFLATAVLLLLYSAAPN